MPALRKIGLAARALRDDRGVSAVEFALILPVLVMLYLGCVEVSQALTVDRKVTTAASVVGDLVAQGGTLSDSDFQNIFDATGAILMPYDASPLKIVVSYVHVTSDGNEVVWSEASNDTPRACNSKMDIPADVAVEGNYLVVAEVHYLYTPTFGETIKKNLNFSNTFYLRPRNPHGITHDC